MTEELSDHVWSVFLFQEIVTALEFGTSVPFGPPFYR